MPENYDAIADDENEWGEPVEIEPVPTVATVLSVRLPLDQAEEIRAMARARGIKVGTLLRQLITRGLEDVEVLSGFGGQRLQTGILSSTVTLFFDGSAPQVIPSNAWDQWSGALSNSNDDPDALLHQTGV